MALHSGVSCRRELESAAKTHLDKVSSESAVTRHRSLQVHLATDLERTCIQSPLADTLSLSLRRVLTQIGPVERLVAQPDSEVSLCRVKLGDSQAATIHRDRVPDGAVGEDGGGIGDDEAVALVFGCGGDGGDGAEVLS